MTIKYQKILVPLDGAELGEAALAHVMYLALLSGADVTLLYVVPTIDDVIGGSPREQMDLIAMSTHGRSGVRRWLLGGVAHKVVHAASTPVLLIRPPSIAGEPPFHTR
jgi:nucleotide-binding universal stress UspA family protein